MVRTRISSGEYGPGTRLVERKLAEEFGTSQGPVRDAIRTLEARGLVRSKPNAGSWVRGSCHLELASATKVKAVLLQLREKPATRLLGGNVFELESLQYQIARAAKEARMEDVVRLVHELTRRLSNPARTRHW